MAEVLQEELINFMFIREEGVLNLMECLKLWFGKSNNTDIEIRDRFGENVAKALKGEYNDWKTTPRGSLALMILIDQFPRNVYRHSVHMFDGDRDARKIIDAGHDWLEVLKPEECIFVPCLILTHQENVEDQQLCLEYYNKLEPRLSSELHIFRTIFEEHFRIVDLCGCFPHRDHYYGRETSATGRLLMDNPKIRFDLPLICDAGGNVRFGNDATKLWLTTQVSFDILEHIDNIVKDKKHSPKISTNWLTPQRVAELQDAFRKFDKDGSGFLEFEELKCMLESTGRPYGKEELQGAVQAITGTPSSTGLTFEQFTTLIDSQHSNDWQDRVRSRFQFFDLDRSGEISREELAACIRGLDSLVTTDEIEEMMNKCDKNGDGLLSYEEFLAMVPEYMQVQTEVVLPKMDVVVENISQTMTAV